MSDNYIVYTDGACSNNQAAGGQPGGWGVVFLDGRTFSGGTQSTTNNRMELTAVIEALKNTPKASTVEINSDSAYIINAFEQKWISNWKKRNWMNSQGKPVENQDLWKELISLEQERDVKWVKVKGHSGNKWNEIADKLAVEAIPTNKLIRNKNNLEATNKNIFVNIPQDKYIYLLKKLKDLAKDDDIIKDIYQDLNKQTSTN